MMTLSWPAMIYRHDETGIAFPEAVFLWREFDGNAPWTKQTDPLSWRAPKRLCLCLVRSPLPLKFIPMLNGHADVIQR
jgi:hypothetical protein